MDEARIVVEDAIDVCAWISTLQTGERSRISSKIPWETFYGNGPREIL